MTRLRSKMTKKEREAKAARNERRKRNPELRRWEREHVVREPPTFVTREQLLSKRKLAEKELGRSLVRQVEAITDVRVNPS